MVLAFRCALVKPHTTSIFSCRPTCGNTTSNGQWNREIVNNSLPPQQFLTKPCQLKKGGGGPAPSLTLLPLPSPPSSDLRIGLVQRQWGGGGPAPLPPPPLTCA